MFKISHIVFTLMAIWTAGLLFWTSQSVQQAGKELRDIKKSSYAELEMVRVLSSEWDYLNRPERLEELAKSYLTIDNIIVDDSKLLTSIELIQNSVSPALPKRKPNDLFKFVSQKNTAKVSQEEVSSVITKPEQENFNSFIESLSLGEEQ